MFRTRFSALIITAVLATGVAPAGAIQALSREDGSCKLALTSKEQDLYDIYNPPLPVYNGWKIDNILTTVGKTKATELANEMGSEILRMKRRAVDNPQTQEDKNYVKLLGHLQGAYRACAAGQNYDSVAVDKAKAEAAARARKAAEAKRRAEIEKAAQELAAKKLAATKKLEATKTKEVTAPSEEPEEEGSSTALAIGGVVASLVAVVASILPYYAHALPAGFLR